MVWYDLHLRYQLCFSHFHKWPFWIYRIAYPFRRCGRRDNRYLFGAAEIRKHHQRWWQKTCTESATKLGDVDPIKYNMLAKLSSSGSTCKWSGLVMFCSLQEKENAGHEKTWQDMKRNSKEHKVKNMKNMNKTKFIFFHSFFCFFLISWVSRKWDNLHLVFDWENASWDHCFSLSAIFCDKTPKSKIFEKHMFFFQKKRKSQTCCTCHER